MPRDYGSAPLSICSNPKLAQCGLVGGILYLQGRERRDAYGRLPADPEVLKAEVVAQWVFTGAIDVPAITRAVDQLAAVGLWHRYIVNGVAYIEYLGFDDEQTDTWKGRRGVKGTYPDPPDRPDLWAANRPHNPGKDPKRKVSPVPDSDPTDPHGSADLPADSPTLAGVPSPVAVTREVSSSDEREEFIREGVRQLARAQEQHSGSTLSPADHQKLRAAVEDAWDAQVPWQSLLTIMREKQQTYQPTRTSPRIKSVGYYQASWDAQIRAARAQGATSPGSPPQPPPEDDDDQIAARVRAQSAALRYADAASA